MIQHNSKVTIHMVSSLDGYIASKDGNVDWLNSNSIYEGGVSLSKDEIANYLEGIDCYIMGSKTYETALKLGWPYGNKPVYVISTRTWDDKKPNISFFKGDLKMLVNNDLKTRFKNIWVVGGALLASQFLKERLADVVIKSIVPVVIGEGTMFFKDITEMIRLNLSDVIAYKNGMVELTYKIKYDDV